MKPLAVFVLIYLVACAAPQRHEDSLYQALGQKEGIQKIVGRFIFEIGDSPQIRPYFEESNLDRFYEKLTEQLCELSGGPCRYTGDSMIDSHTKMNVTEADFNLTVDLLIAAMDHQNIPHSIQNQLLNKLAPLREDIIYR